MGYASFLEDIVNKLSDMNLMIDNSTQASTTMEEGLRKKKRQFSSDEIDEMYESLQFTKRELIESKSKVYRTEIERQNVNDELKKMQDLIGAIREQNESLKFRIDEKEILLVQLRKEISSILEKNEIARKIAENRSREILDNTVKQANDENAKIVLELKSGIFQISSIIHQHNFHKKADNINTIKLIIKKLTGFY